MKKIYFYYFLSLCGIALMYTGCSEGAIGDDFAENNYAARGAVVSASNVQTGFFDQVNPGTSAIAFDLASKGETVSSVDVLVSYAGGGEAVLTQASVGSTVDVAFNDVLSLLSVPISSVEVGDNVVFAFDATTPSGTYRSSKILTVPVACSSDLGGTYDYVSTGLYANNGFPCPAGEVTGTVTFTDMGGGTYHCSDLGFGQYGSSCWNDSPASSGNATFKDVCNQIISGGLDQYGLTYIWTITDVSGTDLSITWYNDYDDGGDVVITRTDGTNWPALFTN